MDQETLGRLRFEYHAWLAATRQDEFSPRIIDTTEAPSFYDYLLLRGYTRFQLSAYGIGRDVQA